MAPAAAVRAAALPHPAGARWPGGRQWRAREPGGAAAAPLSARGDGAAIPASARGCRSTFGRRSAALDMDAVAEADVALILRLSDRWIADQMPNEPVRANRAGHAPDRPRHPRRRAGRLAAGLLRRADSGRARRQDG
jgi:hypothetical protein